MREDVQFDADGTTLRGWLYRPDNGAEIHPAVVLAHGFSAVKEMGLDRYAEVFSAAGLICLVYDNRNLGASDGEPRDEIDPVAQMRDYGHAVTYLQTRAEVDAQHIGIWGTSYTGGLVLIAAATDRRVKCVVSQVPFLHGLRTLQRYNSPAAVRAAHAAINAERASRCAGNPPATVAVCSYDTKQAPSSPGNRTHTFFHAFDVRGGFDWPNRITVRSQELRLEYNALGFAAHVSPTPLLMIVASTDDITPTDIAIEAYESAREPKKLHIVTGDHYRPYLEAFDEASAEARDWFVTHLMTAPAA